MLSMAIKTAATIRARLTMIDAIGSAFPCPYGWSSSGGLMANLSPKNTTVELTTSEKDSTPSATRAKECPRYPATHLNDANTRLAAIPTRDDRMPWWTSFSSGAVRGSSGIIDLHPHSECVGYGSEKRGLWMTRMSHP